MSFEHASVSKGLMVSCAVTSILAGIFDIKHYFHLQFVPHISRHHQYWRLLVHHLAFSNSSDLLLGELIIFNAGVQIERQFGSIKFASFAFVITLVATLFEFMAVILFHRVGLNHIAVGPSALVFSILYQYSRIVPSTYNYRIFGVPLTNKSINYLLGFQIAISRLPGSAAVAVIGILTGQLYRSDLASLKTYRLPPSVVRFIVRFVGPLFGASRPPRRSNRALSDDSRESSVRNTENTSHNDEVITTARMPPTGAVPRARATDGAGSGSSSVVREWVDELTGRTERANAGIRVPSEAEIVQLTTMFPSLDREVVIGALQRSPNIEGAVEILLVSQR